MISQMGKVTFWEQGIQVANFIEDYSAGWIAVANLKAIIKNKNKTYTHSHTLPKCKRKQKIFISNYLNLIQWVTQDYLLEVQSLALSFSAQPPFQYQFL